MPGQLSRPPTSGPCRSRAIALGLPATGPSDAAAEPWYWAHEPRRGAKAQYHAAREPRYSASEPRHPARLPRYSARLLRHNASEPNTAARLPNTAARALRHKASAPNTAARGLRHKATEPNTAARLPNTAAREPNTAAPLPDGAAGVRSVANRPKKLLAVFPCIAARARGRAAGTRNAARSAWYSSCVLASRCVLVSHYTAKYPATQANEALGGPARWTGRQFKAPR
jgi:hypothetical protein